MQRTITRVVGRRHKPKNLLGSYDVPVEAIELATDIAALEQARNLLRSVRNNSIAEDMEEAAKDIWSINNKIDQWLGYARGILKRRYLAK